MKIWVIVLIALFVVFWPFVIGTSNERIRRYRVLLSIISLAMVITFVALV